jgi:ADP-heptose:LPS heptosyltransferase
VNDSRLFQILVRAVSPVAAKALNMAATAKAITKKHLVPRLAPAIFAFDALVIHLGRRFRPHDDACNVVFVRTDNLGDFILWLPAARALRAHWPWPNRRFVLVANNSWAHFAESLGIFDRVISLSRLQFQRNPIYRAKELLFRLSRIRADLVVTAVYSRDPLTSDSVARAICAPRKVAPDGNSSSTNIDLSLSYKWYTELIGTPGVSTHETVRNAAFVKQLADISVPNALPRLCVPTEEKLPSILRGLRYAVLAPGAVASLRIWPAAAFAELADRLFDQLGVRSVLTGTASERRFTSAILRASKSSPIDLAGQTDLSNLCAVLAHAKIIVTNETGTAHLGAALGVQTICITGGGHFGRFVPYPAEGRQEDMPLSTVQCRMSCYGCDWNCIYSLKYSDAAPCVSSISVNEVWAAARALGATPEGAITRDWDNQPSEAR